MRVEDLEGKIKRGKVRDTLCFDDMIALMTTDRISAFDVVLPRGIPYKGQVLNQIAVKFLDATTDICPNWKIDSPDPSVTIGKYCTPFPVEMIIRGYLTGSSWRSYKNGSRAICGISIPDGMKEHERFPEPIVTPTTKATEGHDEDISREEIIRQGLVSAEDYTLLEKYTKELFQIGTKMANEKGLILVDTKYEFGKGDDGRIYLIDEIHTPDSSRYFYLDGYEERQAKGEQQKQLSKEFVREWLMANNFMGNKGQQVPEMTDDIVNQISERYIELYEQITVEKFVKSDTSEVIKRVERNITDWLQTH